MKAVREQVKEGALIDEGQWEVIGALKVRGAMISFSFQKDCLPWLICGEESVGWQGREASYVAIGLSNDAARCGRDEKYTLWGHISKLE